MEDKIIIAILQGDKELNAICAENNLNSNMVRKWKQEFLANAKLSVQKQSIRLL